MEFMPSWGTHWEKCSSGPWRRGLGVNGAPHSPRWAGVSRAAGLTDRDRNSVAVKSVAKEHCWASNMGNLHYCVPLHFTASRTHDECPGTP